MKRIRVTPEQTNEPRFDAGAAAATAVAVAVDQSLTIFYGGPSRSEKNE